MDGTGIDPLAPLAAAVDVTRSCWGDALGGLASSVVVDDDVAAMSDAGLLAVNEAIAVMERHCQALHARIAAAIGTRSAPELGRDGLARKAGYRSPGKLIAAATGGHPADAQRLIQVGDATTGRITFTGERAPARHPHIGDTLDHGQLNMAAASAITTLLDRVACRIDRATLDEAEETLTAQAVGLSLTQVHVLLQRAEAWLDPDGLPPKIDDLRRHRSLHIREDHTGMILIDGNLDPETAAPIKAALDALVTTHLRGTRGHNHPDTSDGVGDGHGDGPGDATAGNGDGHGGDSSGTGWAWDGPDDGTGLPIEQRTIPQLQADALATLARHLLGCDHTNLPLVKTTVVVRIPLDALTTGTGTATIDGITQPIDITTARRMTADAEIIPLVLGTPGGILDYGRTRRLFTRTQRLALIERDGGCAACGAPPGQTEAHHIHWWSHGGKTNLNNLILLCTSCHHRIHTDGWDIRINGDEVWFTPPTHIDPTRTPRPGGRHRYDYTPAA